MRAVVVAGILGLAFLSACAGQIKNYSALEVTAWNVPAQVMLAAARQVATENGWQVIEHQPDRLAAVSAGAEVAGALTRERWTFRVTEEGLSVVRRLEVQWETGAPWEWAADVCSGYQYLSERQVVEAIHMRLIGNEDQPVLLDDVWVVTAAR